MRDLALEGGYPWLLPQSSGRTTNRSLERSVHRDKADEWMRWCRGGGSELFAVSCRSGGSCGVAIRWGWRENGIVVIAAMQQWQQLRCR